MINNEYIELLKHQAPMPEEIKPVQKVINNRIESSSLFKVKQFGKTFIYKISDSNTSFRNLMLAQILLEKDIAVPDSKVFISGGKYFERYEILQGRPLSNAIMDNSLTKDEIEKVLYDMIACDYKISKIDVSKQNFANQLILSARRKNHHTKDFGKFIAKVLYVLNKAQEKHGRIALHHADLNPSNVLLDDNGNFKALLDLDSLALCNEYTMLSQILFLWPNLSLDKVVEIYESVYGEKLNKRYLQGQLHLKRIKANVAKTLRKIKSYS